MTYKKLVDFHCLSISFLSFIDAHTHISLSLSLSLSLPLSLSFSGNGMGNHGARSLAKTLLTNTCLSEVSWDRNETGAQGFMDVAAALEQ